MGFRGEREDPSLGLFRGMSREKEQFLDCGILFKLEQAPVESQISAIFLVIFLL